jgi:hypothetical protein
LVGWIAVIRWKRARRCHVTDHGCTSFIGPFFLQETIGEIVVPTTENCKWRSSYMWLFLFKNLEIIVLISKKKLKKSWM